MGIRSDWIYQIAKWTGWAVHDIPSLRKALESQGISARLGTIEDLEAIAFHLGVPDARNIPLRLIAPKTDKRRKSLLSDGEILELSKQGLSQSEISRLAGISRQSILIKLREAKLQGIR